jgi:putative acyl-CoA dehydrogenase
MMSSDNDQQSDSNIAPGETHRVSNVASELENYNLFSSDAALVESVRHNGGSWGLAELHDFGALIGERDYIALGQQANRYPPELDTHDRFGNRVDLVNYHPAYHQLMTTALQHQLHAAPWLRPGPGAHVVRGAKQLLHSQIEAGHGCPITMTFASIPAIRAQPELAALLEPKILHSGYQPDNIPLQHKQAITIGMGMTEKQGGSDVRQNASTAVAVQQSGPGQWYRLTGHKWFLSAPMCDAFLMLAQTAAGLSCFLLPRWLPDGSKNSLHIIRLKDKMANKSNASSEVEFRDAGAWLIGAEGRGVATIIQMVNLTRFDCIGGSAAIMRAGVANAIYHCQQRQAFGGKLIEQPLMQNVLADLALEYEAAVALHARMARALDNKDDNADEAALVRLATAVGKYWVCKRAPQHSYEVMECIGGSGVMENSPYPRLYREAVINSIWEGSGNVQCLDVLRAVAAQPATLDSFIAELTLARGGNRLLDQYVSGLQKQLLSLASQPPDSVEFAARRTVDQMALALQGALLVAQAPSEVSEAFCSSRLATTGAHNYGSLQPGPAINRLLERADPNSSTIWNTP